MIRHRFHALALVALMSLQGGSLLLQAQYEIVPASPQWHPNEILEWSPETDPDAPYNRSTVPLAERFITPTASQDPGLNALWNVNSHARPDEARVQVVTTFNTIPAGGSQGWRTTRLYAPSIWQYTDSMVFWGSSDRDSRTILTPTAHTIDAAHRNGVRIYGKIFYHWNASPDNAALQRIRDLLQKSGDTFPVADKLIEAALYYGFDGWFINQENYQTNSTDAQNMRDFMAYFRTKARSMDASHLKIVWYDAMGETGSRSFQNAFTTGNDGFMKSGDSVTDVGNTLAAHEMFLNFWWYYNEFAMENSRSLALSRRIDPYDIYAGIWTENYRTLGNTPDPNGGGNISIPWEYLFPEGERHHLSLALFGGETPFIKGGSSPANVVAQDEIYWSGPNHDPSDTNAAGSSTPNWHGIAHYIPTNSAITDLPFITNFNLGQGERYFINGTEKMAGPWTNLSLQDLLPTWRWIIESDGALLEPEFDYDDAYYGGASLRVTGTLDADQANELKLYQTSLMIEETTNVRLVYKTDAVNSATIRVGLAFEDAPDTIVYSAPAPAISSSWSTQEFSLGAHAGRTLAAISLHFASPTTVADYGANIGRIEIQNGNSAAPASPSGLIVEASGRNPDDPFATQLRLKWIPSPDPVLHYNVYYRPSLSADTEDDRVWLGATPNHYFFAQLVRRHGVETQGYIEVEAVSPDYGVSAAVSTIEPTLTFESFPNLHHPFITSYPPSSWMITGSGNDFANHALAFDNDLNSFAEPGGADGAWVGLDLGGRTSKRVTAIQFVPRNNWSSRMINGVFQGSNTADYSSGVVELARVNTPPAEEEWTTLLVDEPTAFRHVRYLSPDGGYANVAEIKFFGAGDPIPPDSPIALRATTTGTTANLIWEPAPSDIVYAYEVKRSTTVDGPFAVIASNLGMPELQDPGLAQGVTYYYRVAAMNEGGGSPYSDQLVLNPSPATKLSGTIIGGGSPMRGGPFADALDGDLDTHFRASNDAGWVGLDLGADHDITLAAIRYSPRNTDPSTPTNANLMIGGRFQASNTADFSSDLVTLFTIPGPPEYNTLTTAAVAPQDKPYRYVRYVTAEGHAASVSEIEFYGISTAEDDFTRWIIDMGAAPGEPGSGFDQDWNGDGVSNGVEYMAPDGLQITTGANGSGAIAVIRLDAAVTSTMWSSEDLINWTEITPAEAEDQSGVPDGFIRLEAEAGSQPDGRRFYRLQFTR